MKSSATASAAPEGCTYGRTMRSRSSTGQCVRKVNVSSRRLPAKAVDRRPGRWTCCGACLTVFDDYRAPVNPIPEFAGAH
jgi:hypothetical protein